MGKQDEKWLDALNKARKAKPIKEEQLEDCIDRFEKEIATYVRKTTHRRFLFASCLLLFSLLRVSAGHFRGRRFLAGFFPTPRRSTKSTKHSVKMVKKTAAQSQTTRSLNPNPVS